MDTNLYISWAEFFVEHVKANIINDKKVFLIHDGYKSHLGVEALDILEKANVIFSFILHILVSFTTSRCIYF